MSTEFDAEAQNMVPEPDLPSKFTAAKIQDGGRPPSRNQVNGYNLAIFERIRTKFDTDTDNEVPEQF